MQIIDTFVVHHEMVGNNMLVLKVRTKHKVANLGLPGQFYQIKLSSNDFQTRVPISIFDVEDQEISFLIKVIGEKTTILKNLRINDDLNIIGPLGNCFSIKENEKYMFVTGGCGYAPLNFLHKYASKNIITWIHGGRNKDEVQFAVRGQKAHIICTDDGSEGLKGYVTSELPKELHIQQHDKVFACGPAPMLKEVWNICKLFNKMLYVSLESYMGCGFGVCWGCAVKVVNSKGEYTYARVCKEGPVFNAYHIVWEELV